MEQHLLRCFTSCVSGLLFMHKKNNTVGIANAGIGGNNAYDLLQRVGEDLLTKNPDLVVLMIGTNDMLNPEKAIPGTQFSKNLNTLVIAIQKKARVILLTILPFYKPFIAERQSK